MLIVTTMSLQLHSVTLLNIADHVTRELDTAFGVLVGRVSDSCTVYTSFELLLDSTNTSIDNDYLYRRCTQFTTVLPHYSVVGLYHIGSFSPVSYTHLDVYKRQLPYYQVKEFNREFGPPNEFDHHQFFGMGQYDPIIDYIQSNEDDEEFLRLEETDKFVDYYNSKRPTYGHNDEDTVKNNYDYHMFQSSSLFFLHANWPKWFLEEVFIENYHGRGPLDADDLRRRLYDKDLPRELGGYDFEKVIVKNLKWCFCETTQFKLTGVPEDGTPERAKICKEIEAQLKYYEENKP